MQKEKIPGAYPSINPDHSFAMARVDFVAAVVAQRNPAQQNNNLEMIIDHFQSKMKQINADKFDMYSLHFCGREKKLFLFLTGPSLLQKFKRNPLDGRALPNRQLF